MTLNYRHATRTAGSSWRRIRALTLKETRQMFRDPSSIAIGLVLPVILILLFGYGLSLDVTDVPIAIVMEDTSQPARGIAAGFELSPCFRPTFVPSMRIAQDLLLDHQVEGIVRLRSDLSRRLNSGQAPIQVLVNGIESNRARLIQAYCHGAIAQWAARRSAEGEPGPSVPVVVSDRLWFNSANDSHYFLVPGLIVLVMTLIGAFLTAMVVAREWERGTIEALFVTPVRGGEILLSKIIPYFILGMLGLGLCLLSGKFLFHVPLRGSLLVLGITSMLYLLVALGMGLLISTLTKSQFVASQLAVLVTFLPATLLSGFLFDLRSMPAAVRAITYILPARYYVSLLQTIFLAGNVWQIVLPNALVLAGMAAAVLILTRLATRKRLE